MPKGSPKMSIDRGIPIPRRVGRPISYPLRDTKVGESFFVPGKTSQSMMGSVAHLKKDGLRFTTRTVTEHGVKGVRVWRIA